MARYYHATDSRNLESILASGLQTDPLGYVYLASTEEDALRFMAFRLVIEEIAVFEVAVDDLNIEESFDHDERLFGCRAWVHEGAIPRHSILNYTIYRR